MEYITSRQNLLVSHIRKLGADRAYRRAQGLFLIEGVKLLEECCKWNSFVDTLVYAEGTVLPFTPPPAERIVMVPADLLKTLSTVETPQGVLAICKAPSLAAPETLPGSRYLVLDGVQDPGNVGTIWRTADAFGADGLFLLPGCADPYSPKTVRASMGACFRLTAWEADLETLTGRLAAASIPLRAAALRDDTADVREVDWTRAAAVIGSEGRGVSGEVLAACVSTVKIPMRERCESLNAAVAASVVLWEMYR
ncbi:RNA methyltransferase, TrmH family [uncultured Eubacteriales bacterium]|uniref:RNA methyltransferase, TrmH family n=1 Tax=uncultured Eubacteriales bacterium TaxID=172733 RepID=A0A212K4Z4_9FIRM|nr:RNA methyltransferase, TrmH family [uncultured Eubacteriales bacterium]